MILEQVRRVATEVRARAAEIRADAKLLPVERENANILARADLYSELVVKEDSATRNFKPGTEEYTDERQALHDAILGKILAKPGAYVSSDSQPVAVIMGGLPASGKTTSAGSSLDLSDKIYINADDIRSDLPGYNGWNSVLFHREASELADAVFSAAVAGRANIVYDVTMKSRGAPGDSGILGKIQALKDAGYRTEIRFTDVSVATSLERVVQRLAGEVEKKGWGRNVPRDYVRDLGATNPDGSPTTKNRLTFNSVKDLVDAYILVDNNGGKG